MTWPDKIARAAQPARNVGLLIETHTVWTPSALAPDRPAYIAIANAIADDIASGKLTAHQQLPPQRLLAEHLGLNFSTVSRAYSEAQSRGLLEARVGQGTFVRAQACPRTRAPDGRAPLIDMSMNLPPEPDQPALLARMASALERVRDDLRALMRYQPFGGSPDDRAAALQWLSWRGVAASPEQTLVCPGTHSVLHALFGMLAGPGARICCDSLVYPGVRSLAALHGITLEGLASDHDGVTPEALERACRAARPAAFYCNPTLQNPTTVTQSLLRRHALIEVAQRHDVPIIEDDVYGLLAEDAPAAFATLAPASTYYIGGLSKTLGAGLRLAYLVAPELRHVGSIAARLRSATVMPSPLCQAIATQWIHDGTAAELVAFIRAESRARQKIAAEALAHIDYAAPKDGFHLWLPLPDAWSRVSFASSLRHSGVGVVTSDAFQVGGPPVEAVRLCLGGAASREQIRQAFDLIASALSQSPAIFSTIV